MSTLQSEYPNVDGVAFIADVIGEEGKCIICSAYNSEATIKLSAEAAVAALTQESDTAALVA